MSRRELPAVHRLLADAALAAFAPALGAEAVKSAVGEALDRARRRIASDGSEAPSVPDLIGEVVERLRAAQRQGLVEVINATGVLLHTNLGRAPLAREALAAMEAVAGGYSNLEFDLDAGTRGTRYAHAVELLRAVTGAGDALVVNNCAAAVLLVLDTFAKGREVVVARGELIEIGGGFRIPDVLARSGATLVEVGTTNKVHLRDFERALSPRTALVLRTHPSNFRIEGFTAGVSGAELCALGRRTGIPVVEDLGSGALVDLARYGLRHERTVQEAVADGIDLIAFSGDKLLGGPQAGIIVGRAPAIARLRANPLLRALRVDKLTLGALAATLRLYLAPDAPAGVPLYAMLGASLESLRARADALASELTARGISARAIETQAALGGGSAPMDVLPSVGLALDCAEPDAAIAALRGGAPPVVARIDDGKVVLDLRTVPPERDAEFGLAVLENREAGDAYCTRRLPQARPGP